VAVVAVVQSKQAEVTVVQAVVAVHLVYLLQLVAQVHKEALAVVTQDLFCQYIQDQAVVVKAELVVMLQAIQYQVSVALALAQLLTGVH
jgi:hypothetical protein